MTVLRLFLVTSRVDGGVVGEETDAGRLSRLRLIPIAPTRTRTRPGRTGPAAKLHERYKGALVVVATREPVKTDANVPVR